MSRAPYKFLDYYTFEDAELFFGREEETYKMVGEILSTRLLVLFSPSGSGKTSLINAGVRPQLKKMGYKTIYTRLEDEPTFSVCQAVSKAINISICSQDETLYDLMKKAAKESGKPLVIFLDQFEEFFIEKRDKKELRQKFIEQVAKIKYDDELPVFLVLSLREDYFVKLYEFREAIPSIFQNNANIRLEPFTDEAARRAIEGPLESVDCAFEEGMVDTLVKDLKKNRAGIEPITLQIVCSTLWNQKPEDSKQIHMTTYEACGRADKILNNFIDERLKKVHWYQRRLMVKVFEALKTPDNTKQYRHFEALQTQLSVKRPQRLKKILQKLSHHDILRKEERGGTNRYEFKHDYLVKEVNRWIQERKEEKIRRRPIYILIILIIAFFLFLFIGYNIFNAHFNNPKYPFQQQEIVISRSINPFGEPLTTGYFINDVKDFEAEKVLRAKFNISFWDKNDWQALIEKLSLAKSGEFLYYTGQPELGIKRLIQSLQNESKFTNQVTQKLLKFGRSDNRVIDALVSSLKEENYLIRCYAAKILGVIGQPDDQLTKILMNILKEDDERLVRYHAAVALIKLEKFSDSISKVLVEALKDQYSRCDLLADLLSGIIKADKPLIKALIETYNWKDVDIKRQAKNKLVIIGKFDDRVIEELIVAIKSKEHKMQNYAAEVLGKIGKTENRIIKALLEAFKYDEPSVRYQAAEVLVKLGNTDKKVIDILITGLEEKDLDLRDKVLETLGLIEQSSSLIAEALIKTLNAEDPINRKSAANALVKTGKINRQVIRKLKELLKVNNSAVNYQAAIILGKIGIKDNQVKETLLKALNDKDSDVWHQTPAALGKIGHPDHRVIEALIRAFESGDTAMQGYVADALYKIGSSDKPVIETLMRNFKGGTGKIRGKIVETLGKIGYYNNRIIELLIAALADKDIGVRSKASDALGELLHSKSEIYLLNLLEHPLSGYRKAGAHALVRKKSISEKTLDKIKRLKDNDKRPWGRMAAWEAYELIHQRNRKGQNANRFIKEANTLFKGKEYLKAECLYQYASQCLLGIHFAVPEKAANIKFQLARCSVKRKQILSTLDYLEEAFQYNPALRKNLKEEMRQKGSDWEFIKDNWYLNEILLKNSEIEINGKKVGGIYINLGNFVLL